MNWFVARTSWARRWRALPKFWPHRTVPKFSTVTAAPNRALSRFPLSRRPFWFRKSRFRRKISRRINPLCCHFRKTRRPHSEDRQNRGGNNGGRVDPDRARFRRGLLQRRREGHAR